jgi:hypothetical protein
MSSFDVRVFAIRRRPGRAAFEVRWRVARRDKSRSFTARALADSYRAELIRAARRGLEFDPATGEPAAWTAPKPTAISWYRHAVAYEEMKWPRLAPHSRASLADALATVTVLLTRPTARRPADRVLRAALYGYAFNSQQRVLIANPAASALAWLERASLPVTRLSDPPVILAALDGLCVRLDGRPAAAVTIRRKRAVFHNALSYAVELGLLPANPISQVQWRTHGSRRHPSGRRSQPGANRGDPGSSQLSQTGADRFLRLPVLRRTAPGGSSRLARRGPHPPGRPSRQDHPHLSVPAYRHPVDQHRHAS